MFTHLHHPFRRARDDALAIMRPCHHTRATNMAAISEESGPYRGVGLVCLFQSIRKCSHTPKALLRVLGKRRHHHLLDFE